MAIVFGKSKGWSESKQLSFLLREIERLNTAGKLDAQVYSEIQSSLKQAEEKYGAEFEELNRQAKLKLGRRLLLFFGSSAFAIGIGFLIFDYYEWFRGFFEFIQELVKWFLRMPPPVRAIELVVVTALLFRATLRQQHTLEKSSRLFAYLALGVLLAVNCFKVPDWLFSGSFTTQEHLLAGILLFAWGYYTSFKTIVYAGLFLLCGWLGGGTGYGFASYFIWMKDPMLFLPFSIALLSLAWWIDLYHNKYVVQPVEIVGLTGLFIALLILSIWGYDGKPKMDIGHIGPVWFIILMTLTACTAIALGIKFNRQRYYGFGITFLSINLYTRFYEVFSGWLPRPIFWLSFGFLLLWGGKYVNQLLRKNSTRAIPA